jgi:hypothetical protein
MIGRTVLAVHRSSYCSKGGIMQSCKESIRAHWKTRLVLWLLGTVGFLLALLLWLAGCGTGAKGTEKYYTPLRVYSARAVITDAFAVARYWHPDAYLVDIDVEMAREGEIILFPVEFGFQSPSDEYHSLAVRCSRPAHCGKQVFRHPVAVYRTVPIEPDDFAIDSVEAAKIAQRHGGEKFIKRKDVVMDVQLGRFKPRGKGPVFWVASYFDAVTREGLYVYIDAKTGEVVGDERMNSRLRW